MFGVLFVSDVFKICSGLTSNLKSRLNVLLLKFMLFILQMIV